MRELLRFWWRHLGLLFTWRKSVHPTSGGGALVGFSYCNIRHILFNRYTVCPRKKDCDDFCSKLVYHATCHNVLHTIHHEFTQAELLSSLCSDVMSIYSTWRAWGHIGQFCKRWFLIHHTNKHLRMGCSKIHIIEMQSVIKFSRERFWVKTRLLQSISQNVVRKSANHSNLHCAHRINLPTVDSHACHECVVVAPTERRYCCRL